jgi:DNA-binding transcriptional regulator YiaG
LIEKDKLGENIKKIKKNTELSQKVFDDLKTWENRRFDNNEKINLI